MSKVHEITNMSLGGILDVMLSRKVIAWGVALLPHVIKACFVGSWDERSKSLAHRCDRRGMQEGKDVIVFRDVGHKRDGT